MKMISALPTEAAMRSPLISYHCDVGGRIPGSNASEMRVSGSDGLEPLHPM